MLICPVCPFVNLWTKVGLYPENMGVYHSQKKKFENLGWENFRSGGARSI